jgi:hypothetical protein
MRKTGQVTNSGNIDLNASCSERFLKELDVIITWMIIQERLFVI